MSDEFQETAERAINAIGDRWGLSIPTGDMSDPEARFRVAAILDIYEGLFSVLRNSDAERRLIREERAECGGLTIAEVIDTPHGDVEHLGAARSFVDRMCGRC